MPILFFHLLPLAFCVCGVCVCVCILLAKYKQHKHRQIKQAKCFSLFPISVLFLPRYFLLLLFYWVEFHGCFYLNELYAFFQRRKEKLYGMNGQLWRFLLGWWKYKNDFAIQKKKEKVYTQRISFAHFRFFILSLPLSAALASIALFEFDE